jgi:hypothetical protein
MTDTFRTGAFAVALLGAAFFAAPAVAADLDEGDYGGTYRYIGPGAASEPDQDVGPAYGPPAYGPAYAAPAAPYGPPPYAADVPYPPPAAYGPPPVEDYAPEAYGPVDEYGPPPYAPEGYAPGEGPGLAVAVPGARLFIGGY